MLPTADDDEEMSKTLSTKTTRRKKSRQFFSCGDHANRRTRERTGEGEHANRRTRERTNERNVRRLRSAGEWRGGEVSVGRSAGRPVGQVGAGERGRFKAGQNAVRARCTHPTHRTQFVDRRGSAAAATASPLQHGPLAARSPCSNSSISS